MRQEVGHLGPWRNYLDGLTSTYLCGINFQNNRIAYSRRATQRLLIKKIMPERTSGTSEGAIQHDQGT